MVMFLGVNKSQMTVVVPELLEPDFLLHPWGSERLVSLQLNLYVTVSSLVVVFDDEDEAETGVDWWSTNFKE